MNSKNLTSPSKEFNLMKKLAKGTKGAKSGYKKAPKSIDLKTHTLSMNHTPKLNSSSLGKHPWESCKQLKCGASINYDSGSDLLRNFVANDYISLGVIRKKASADSCSGNPFTNKLLCKDNINRSIKCDKNIAKKKINVKSNKLKRSRSLSKRSNKSTGKLKANKFKVKCRP